MTADKFGRGLRPSSILTSEHEHEDEHDNDGQLADLVVYRWATARRVYRRNTLIQLVSVNFPGRTRSLSVASPYQISILPKQQAAYEDSRDGSG